MEDMKKRIANLERVVSGLTIQAAEYIDGNEDMEKPSSSDVIIIDDLRKESETRIGPCGQIRSALVRSAAGTYTTVAHGCPGFLLRDNLS